MKLLPEPALPPSRLYSRTLWLPPDPPPLFNAPAERVFPDKSSIPAVPPPPRINAVPSGMAPATPINIVPLFVNAAAKIVPAIKSHLRGTSTESKFFVDHFSTVENADTKNHEVNCGPFVLPK